jgi:hypothetical protein
MEDVGERARKLLEMVRVAVKALLGTTAHKIEVRIV